MSSVGLEEVRALKSPCKTFLCDLAANTYQIEFIYFRVRSVQTNRVLFEAGKRPEDYGKVITSPLRQIRYKFDPDFFNLGPIGATIKFRVGARPVKNFTMVEHHYFKGDHIRSYQFTVPFCMPKSQNELETIYEQPELSPELIADMIASPGQTVADSFYFVNGQLMLHNKALFDYSGSGFAYSASK